jgi:hypothetical protein
MLSIVFIQSYKTIMAAICALTVEQRELLADALLPPTREELEADALLPPTREELEADALLPPTREELEADANAPFSFIVFEDGDSFIREACYEAAVAGIAQACADAHWQEERRKLVEMVSGLAQNFCPGFKFTINTATSMLNPEGKLVWKDCVKAVYEVVETFQPQLLPVLDNLVSLYDPKVENTESTHERFLKLLNSVSVLMTSSK